MIPLMGLQRRDRIIHCRGSVAYSALQHLLTQGHGYNQYLFGGSSNIYCIIGWDVLQADVPVR
jgi:hypothetical protein